MKWFSHIIKEGERLDNIAYQYWGDTNLAPVLMLDNPHLRPVEEPEAGTEIFVRESVEDEVLTNLANLPPWR